MLDKSTGWRHIMPGGQLIKPTTVIDGNSAVGIEFLKLNNVQLVLLYFLKRNLLETCPLGFKARVGSLICTLAEAYVIYTSVIYVPEIHV